MKLGNTHHTDDSRLGIVILGLQECQEIAISEVTPKKLQVLHDQLSSMKSHVEYMMSNLGTNKKRTDIRSFR